MNRSVILIILGCMFAAGFGVFKFFKNYNPAVNSNIPKPIIRVYTHSSFMSPTGPGPEIARIFEQTCHCIIQFEDAGSGGLLLQKLKLATHNKADVVIGLDQLLLKEAAQTVKWRNLNLPIRDWHPVVDANSYSTFLPYDWSPIVFITRESTENNLSLRAQLKALPAKSLTLPDPKLSTIGMQFLFWLFTYHGDDELQIVMGELKPKIFNVGPDWSTSYGFFRRGHAKYTLSYLTSLAYHWGDEKDKSYKAIILNEPHPIQIEYAGVPDTCSSCGLAERFVEFLSADSSQKIIMQKNYMLPVVNKITAGTIFAELPEVKFLSAQKFDQFLERRDNLLTQWKKLVLGQ